MPLWMKGVVIDAPCAHSGATWIDAIGIGLSLALATDCGPAFVRVALSEPISIDWNHKGGQRRVHQNRLLPILTLFECQSRVNPTSVRRAHAERLDVGTRSLPSGRPDGRLRPDPLALPILHCSI